MKSSLESISEYIVSLPPEHIITLFALYIVLKAIEGKNIR